MISQTHRSQNHLVSRTVEKKKHLHTLNMFLSEKHHKLQLVVTLSFTTKTIRSFLVKMLVTSHQQVNTRVLTLLPEHLKHWFVWKRDSFPPIYRSNIKIGKLSYWINEHALKCNHSIILESAMQISNVSVLNYNI